MNKTVTINISGIIFHIEEDAYENLNKYLSTIKGYFNNTDGGSEIMGDIEARIAELLQQKLNSGKQVILLSDVNYVKDVMGKPEDFASETNSQPDTKPNTPDNFQSEKIKRRLFRNPDEKVLGGVCGGLAAYFDVDVVWIRLAMFLLIFFGGLSLWVYIIMWLIIPIAKTTADRLAMKGEAANVNTIYKNFKEEAEDVKSRMGIYGEEIRNKNYGESIRSNVSIVFNTFFNIIGRFIGFIILVIGSILFFAYLASLFGISIADSNANFHYWKSAIFENQFHYVLALLCFVVVLGIPIIMLIYGGIKLLFKIHYNNRWLNVSLGILWTCGFIVGIIVSITTAKHFTQVSKIKESVELHNTCDTLKIRVNPLANTIKRLNPDNAEDLEKYFKTHLSGYNFSEFGDQTAIVGHAHLNITQSSNDSIELIIIRSARGNNKKEANENAHSISYNYSHSKGELFFDELFLVANETKFRVQELDIRLKIPKGKVIYFDKSVKYFLDDIENTTNTWDGDMIDRRWKMTDKGLECIDCENLNNTREEDDNIIINRNGIKVKNKRDLIIINKEGIKVKSPEKEIEKKEE